MRNHMTTQLNAAFGVVTKDHHTKDSHVRNSLNNIEYSIQKIYSSGSYI